MSTITLPNIRVSSDLTIRLKLKDGGVALDWSTLQNIRVSLYADDQRSMASRCSVSIDEEDSTILVCQYAANKMQYLGVNRVIVQCKYLGEVKTYDKPAFTFVRWTSDQEGEQITIDDPDVDVEISVEDVSSSILQEAVDAAFDAADRANDAAAAAEHMVDIHTGPEGKSAYEVAVEEGYTGTEEEWLASLKGPIGETPDISIGTVTTVEPGTPAAASMSGTPEAPVLNLSIPKGLVGATPNFTVGTVTTGEPGSSVIVTITGTPEAPVLNLTIPQGMQGNTGSSVEYPYELVNNLTTNDATKGLSAAQGYVLDGKVSQLEAELNGLEFSPSLDLEQGYISASTGEDKASTIRLRTINYIKAEKIIFATTSGKMYVFGYKDDGTYIGASGWLTTSQEISITGAEKYRLQFAFSNDATITVPEFSLLGITVTGVIEGKFVKKDELSVLASQVSEKLDKIHSDNIINPDEIESNKALPWNSISGEPTTVSGENYKVTGYIPIKGNNIICNGFLVANTWCPMFVYNEDKTFLRRCETLQYTYQDGDAFVRIGFDKNTIEGCLANYGNTLLPYTRYSEYVPVTKLQEQMEFVLPAITGLDTRVTALEGATELELANIPNCIYSCFDAINNKQRISHLYMSHILGSLDYKNKDIFFENYIRNLPIVPASSPSKTDTTTTINVTPKTVYAPKSFATKLRMVNNTVSKDYAPRILVIGDSVSFGYGADSNKAKSWLPDQYWAYAKMLFELDKINSGDNAGEYDALFVGGVLVNGNFTLHYNNTTRSVRAKAEAMGGASLDQLFTSTFGNSGGVNPFYDSANNTFSVLAYLAKYRTMDDNGVRLVSVSEDPSGESVVGSDGLTYTIGTEINTQAKLANRDICKPTHIVINLNHNTSLANYQTYISQVVTKIKTELPGCVIVLMVIDETGGYFPCDYPNYPSDSITYSASSYHIKNNNIYNYILQNIEDEENGVYCFGAQFVQPTAESYPTVEAEFAEYIERDNVLKMQIPNTSVVARTAHPNNICHSAWGFALYSLIKWLIS